MSGHFTHAFRTSHGSSPEAQHLNAANRACLLISDVPYRRPTVSLSTLGRSATSRRDRCLKMKLTQRKRACSKKHKAITESVHSWPHLGHLAPSGSSSARCSDQDRVLCTLIEPCHVTKHKEQTCTTHLASLHKCNMARSTNLHTVASPLAPLYPCHPPPPAPLTVP